MKEMRFADRLLWIDCTAGATVGLVLILFHKWFATFYGLSLEFTLFIGMSNLSYGVFSFSLARQRIRSFMQFKILVLANLLWSVLCAVFVVKIWGTASIFGIGHISLECIFVGGLAIVEWRYRQQQNLKGVQSRKT